MDNLTQEELNQLTAYSTKLKNVALELMAISEQGNLIEKDPSQLFLFKGMCRELKPYFDTFNETWDKLVEFSINAGIKDSSPSEKDKSFQQAARKYYYRACAVYESHMNPTPAYNPETSKSNIGMFENTTLNESRTVRARLPQINLPKFYGSPPDWPLFRDTFKSLIHDECSISPIEKFHFLVASLRGSALSLIKGVPLQASTYEQAWKILIDNYDDKRRLASNYLKTILNYTPFRSKPSANSLKHLISTVVESVNGFKQLNVPAADDYILTYLVIRSLDPIIRREFEKEVIGTEFPTFEQLVKFLKTEWKSLDFAVEEAKTATPRGNTHNFLKYESKQFDTSLFVEDEHRRPNKLNSDYKPKRSFKSSSSITCPVCKSNHTLYNCYAFKELSPTERLAKLTNWSGCTNCLSTKHKINQCQSERRCQTCNKKHHSWLHKDQPSSSIVNEEHRATVLSGISRSGEVILGTALAKIKDGEGVYQTIRLVTDCGSQTSFITKKCIERLGLNFRCTNAPNVVGIGKVLLPQSFGTITCTLRSRIQGGDYTTEAIVVPEITGNLPHSRLPYDVHMYLSAYELADPTYWKPQEVDFLLGGDLYYDLITGAPFCLREDLPRLIPSKLGHIVAGKCKTLNSGTPPTSLLVNNNQDVSQIIKHFWEVEELPKTSIMSAEEVECEEHFMKTHYRMPSGRYVVALPVKTSIKELENPKQQVMSRFLNLEYKLSHKPELKYEYHQFMDEYIKLNHMRPALDVTRYLIPHHCVSKLENGKNKLRVVFDASCRGPKGSLNDHLLVGPKLQPDITDILVTFRTFQVCLVADIVKMYRQILVRPEDRMFQHILWRSEPNAEIQVMELMTVTNGLACSSHLAIRALLQLVHDEGHNYPLASKILKKSVLVDDVVAGADSLDEAIALQKELIALLRLGGLELSKWKTNNSILLSSIIDIDKNASLSLSGNEDCGTKILGLQWFSTDDVFTFHIEKPLAPHTKRGILSTIARIYDPLGLLAPVVFKAKVILQDVWHAKCEWDQQVPKDLDVSWSTFANELVNLKQLKITRYISMPEPATYDLIGCADASQLGYAAVVYLKAVSSSAASIHLVKSKTKLAPTKLMSIPRLELCGALLLARLVESCKAPLSRLSIRNTYLFTDSNIVLGWLRTPLNRLKAFVAHRISEILEITSICSWSHISSEHNPADCASRGLMPCEIENHHLWWSGPSWFLDTHESWPSTVRDNTSLELPELKPRQITTLMAESSDSIIQWMSRTSSYLKLIRSMCYALRFIHNSRQPLNKITCLSLSAMEDARIVCIRMVQSQYILRNKAFISSSAFKSLSPIKDDRGLLRVGGRLEHSKLSYSAKHPIILPNCHFTQILIDYYHKLHLHIGPTSLQSVLQNRYLIISARKLIRSRVRKCVKCQIHAPKSAPPVMGNLPSFRLDEGQIFQHVGVDLGGPFNLKESMRRKAALGKAYLCLFICMVTKAVHLEVVSNCSTEAFLGALHRFIARRGKPQHMYSDCGTNFVGAASTLRDLATWYKRQETQESIYNFATERDIEWHFNPPRAPHFGGIWEAGIKSAKTLFVKNLGDTPFTFEEMSTLFSRIEAVLNSRPLHALSNDPDNLECLTPGHFLIGRPLTSTPEKSLLDLNTNSLRRWQLVQQRVQHFWTKWRSSYLNQLQQRRKWTASHPNLKEGDLVIINDPSCPPAKWPLARIIATHPGSDGIVRVVTISTSTSTFKRPVLKLVPLQLPSNETL